MYSKHSMLTHHDGYQSVCGAVVLTAQTRRLMPCFIVSTDHSATTYGYVSLQGACLDIVLRACKQLRQRLHTT